MSALPLVRHRGVEEYQRCWQSMREFTEQRNSNSVDEIWLLQHPAVYSQGTSCTDLPHPTGPAIPVIASDRGGQITYHGPGQLIFYLLLDLKRLGIGPKSLVHRIEQAVIESLERLAIFARRRQGAPGVYVAQSKIAALGLRLRHGCCYHGLSFNFDLDLAPYQRIDPCGIEGLAVTRLCDLRDDVTFEQIESDLCESLIAQIYG